MPTAIASRTLAVAAALALLLVLPVGAAATGPFSPGAAGAGDPYFPLYGNGGYDVRHYTISVRYRPATDRLSGRTRIDAVATQGTVPQLICLTQNC